MKHSEVLHILLLDALTYEENPYCAKVYLKTLVNKAIDNLEWCDGFDIAVKKGDLENEEYQELLDVIRDAYPEVRVDKNHLAIQLEEALPYFFSMARSSWLVGDGFVIFSDEISIGKYQEERFVWIAKDVSLDGIELLELTENTVKGLYWDGSSHNNYWPNQEFELNLKDGSYKKGIAFQRVYASEVEDDTEWVESEPDWSVFEEKKPWWKFW